MIVSCTNRKTMDRTDRAPSKHTYPRHGQLQIAKIVAVVTHRKQQHSAWMEQECKRKTAPMERESNAKRSLAAEDNRVFTRSTHRASSKRRIWSKQAYLQKQQNSSPIADRRQSTTEQRLCRIQEAKLQHRANKPQAPNSNTELTRAQSTATGERISNSKPARAQAAPTNQKMQPRSQTQPRSQVQPRNQAQQRYNTSLKPDLKQRALRTLNQQSTDVTPNPVPRRQLRTLLPDGRSEPCSPARLLPNTDISEPVSAACPEPRSPARLLPNTDNSEPVSAARPEPCSTARSNPFLARWQQDKRSTIAARPESKTTNYVTKKTTGEMRSHQQSTDFLSRGQRSPTSRIVKADKVQHQQDTRVPNRSGITRPKPATRHASQRVALNEQPLPLITHAWFLHATKLQKPTKEPQSDHRHPNLSRICLDYKNANLSLQIPSGSKENGFCKSLTALTPIILLSQIWVSIQEKLHLQLCCNNRTQTHGF